MSALPIFVINLERDTERRRHMAGLLEQLGLAVDLREYKQCAEILFDLGLCQVRVISNNPLKLRALEEAGLKIVERVSIQVEPTEKAVRYMRTKKEKLGHLLKLDL